MFEDLIKNAFGVPDGVRRRLRLTTTEPRTRFVYTWRADDLGVAVQLREDELGNVSAEVVRPPECDDPASDVVVVLSNPDESTRTKVKIPVHRASSGKFEGMAAVGSLSVLLDELGPDVRVSAFLSAPAPRPAT
jgi:hypothetical protein